MSTQPYSVTDASDYTIPVHGEQRGLHHVAIEVRQDLIANNKGQRVWGRLLARLLLHVYQELVAVERWPNAERSTPGGAYHPTEP